MVFEPIAEGFGKKGKRRRKTNTTTQKDLKRTGATPEQRDSMLLNKLENLGISVDK